jgi:hypothetical protein
MEKEGILKENKELENIFKKIMFFTSVGLFMGFFVGLSNGKKLAEEELAKSPNKYNKLEVFFLRKI